MNVEDGSEVVRSTLGDVGPYLWGRGPSPPSETPISARLGGGEGLWPTLLAASWGPWRPISAPGTP